MFTLLVWAVLLWFCHCDNCRAACAKHDGSYSISQVKKLFVQTLDNAMFSKVDSIYASWATHSIALDWVNREHMDNNNDRINMGVFRHASPEGGMENFNHTISDRLKTKNIFSMGTLDKEMIQIQMSQLHYKCQTKTQECHSYLRWISNNYQRHLSVTDEISDSTFTNETLNVIIAGAGPTGLFLANALANTFNTESVRIVVVEKRVFKNATKRPYSRQWPTDIGLSSFGGAVDSRVTDILRSFSIQCWSSDCSMFIQDHDSDKSFKYSLRTDINMMETALLLSCRSLGVKFVFDESPDYTCNRSPQDSYIGKLVCQADIRIDATGNRLHPFNKRKLVHDNRWERKDLLGMALKMPWQYNPPHKNLTFVAPRAVMEENYIFPLSPKGDPYVVQYLKILHVPFSLNQTLQEIKARCPWFKCGSVYLWEGPDELTMFFNLKEYEVNIFQQLVQDKVQGASLDASFVNSFVASRSSNQDLVDAITRIFDYCTLYQIDGCEDVRLAGPYEMDPYFIYNQVQEKTKLGGKQAPVAPGDWLRIGDSVFQGDFSQGTGLGYHFEIMGTAILNLKNALQNNMKNLLVCW